MVKFETRQDAEILVRNPSPRLFGEKFRDSKKVKANHEKTRLRDLSKTLPRFRDPAKIFRDPSFSRYHSPPLYMVTICRIPEKISSIQGFTYPTAVTVKWKIRELLENLTLIKFGVLSALIIWDCTKKKRNKNND